MLTLSQQKRLNNLEHVFFNALQYLGYTDCLPLNNNGSESQTLLEQTIYNLLDVLPTFAVLKECTFTNIPKRQNILLDQQKALYNVLKILAQTMSKMQIMAYLFCQEKCSQKVKKNFKSLYQLMKNISQQIHQTKFYQPEFDISKKNLFQQILQNFKQILKFQNQKDYFSNICQDSCKFFSSTLDKSDSMDDLLGSQFERKILNPQILDNNLNIIQELKQKIAELEEQLQNCTQKYKKQIQRSNQKLMKMQEKVHRYKLQIQTLQDDIARAQQQKYHDECYIRLLKERLSRFSQQNNQKDSCVLLSSNRLKGFQLSSSFGHNIYSKSQERTYETNNQKTKKNSPVFVSVKKIRKCQ